MRKSTIIKIVYGVFVVINITMYIKDECTYFESITISALPFIVRFWLLKK